MVRDIARLALLAIAATLGASAACAEPITLKLAFFSSDRAAGYVYGVKPFVDAVNSDPSGGVHIDVALSGALGRDPAKQAELILDGTADIAFIVPGLRPDLFPDDAVVQLPGLFSNIREATEVYLQLATERVMNGYEPYEVLQAVTGYPETFHMRTPATSLDDLAGKRIRVNNPMELRVMEKLGATGALLPINQTASAIASGQVDGALLPLAEPLVAFGVARMTTHHYLLAVATAPLALLMNRAVFDGLPAEARAVIEKYSGNWMADRYVATVNAGGQRLLKAFRADPRRTVTEPSAADIERANAAFKAVIDEWMAADSRNVELLAKAKAALADIQ